MMILMMQLNFEKLDESKMLISRPPRATIDYITPTFKNADNPKIICLLWYIRISSAETGFLQESPERLSEITKIVAR